MTYNVFGGTLNPTLLLLRHTMSSQAEMVMEFRKNILYTKLYYSGFDITLEKITVHLSWRRKLSMDSDRSRRLSVREFQVIGPATEKAWIIYVLSILDPPASHSCECTECNMTG